MNEKGNVTDELNHFLRERQLEGLWNIQSAERPYDPKTTVKPYIWKWAHVHEGDSLFDQ